MTSLSILLICISGVCLVSSYNHNIQTRNYGESLRVSEDILSSFKNIRSENKGAGRRWTSKDRSAKDSKERAAERIEASIGKLISPRLKKLVSDSGAEIVERIVNPIANAPKNLYNSAAEGNNGPTTRIRTLVGNIGSAFASNYVSLFLVQQWFNTVTLSVAWILGTGIYQALGGSGSRSFQEPWESLIPNSETMTFVLRELADATERYTLHHDEL